MSFEEAKQFLRREEDEGNSLYDHLSKVLLKVIIEKPTDANKMFEEISSTVRRGSYAPPSLPDEGEEIITPEAKEKQLAWTEKVSKLFKPEGLEDNPDISYPDLIEEAAVFAWAGINFGPEETYRLHLAIKQLASLESLSMKFWGKVITRGGDYYICYAEAPDEPDELDPKVMEGKAGLNKYTYWVCKFAGGEWTKLPLCTPEMIIVARKIRRFFTGDLDAAVPCYPPFPSTGNEACLLRAQIAEITTGTHIAPDGFFMEGDETDEGYKSVVPVDPEEFKESYVPNLDSFKDTGFWKHSELIINAIGRQQLIPQDEEADEEAQIEQPDPIPPMGAIADDTLPNGDPAWTIRTAPSGVAESPNSYAVVTSLIWPGAFSCAYGRKYLNVYCGFGVRAAGLETYQPPAVPPIQPEWVKGEEEEELVEAADKITEPVVEAEDEEEA